MRFSHRKTRNDIFTIEYSTPKKSLGLWKTRIKYATLAQSTAVGNDAAQKRELAVPFCQYIQVVPCYASRWCCGGAGQGAAVSSMTFLFDNIFFLPSSTTFLGLFDWKGKHHLLTNSSVVTNNLHGLTVGSLEKKEETSSVRFLLKCYTHEVECYLLRTFAWNSMKFLTSAGHEEHVEENKSNLTCVE